jgi:hypothetical protein
MSKISRIRKIIRIRKRRKRTSSIEAYLKVIDLMDTQYQIQLEIEGINDN